MVFIFLVLFFVLLIGLPALVSYFVYKFLKRKGYSKAALVLPILIIGTPLYFIYTAFYPNESFYREEFSTNTSLELPKAAIFIDKEATYPDMHGDYAAMAVIKLSQEDYSSILKSLKSNNSFVADTVALGRAYEFSAKFKELNKEPVTLILSNNTKQYFKLAFLGDGRTIVMERVSS